MTISDLVLSVDAAMECETGLRAELFAMSPDMWTALTTAFPAIEQQYLKDQTLAGRPLVLDKQVPIGQLLGYNRNKGLEELLKVRRFKRVLKDIKRSKRR